MKVAFNEPVPVIPPKTYDITGLTEQEYQYLIDALGSVDGTTDDRLGYSSNWAFEFWKRLKDAKFAEVIF